MIMKKFLSFMLVLLLVFGLLAPAQAGSYSTAATGLEITSVQNLGRGQTWIAWKDPRANGPYTVSYMMNLTGGFDSDLMTTTGLWTAAENVKGTSIAVGGIIPGHYCWIVVQDSAGNSAIYEHWPEDYPLFEDFKVDITLQLKTSQNGTVRNVETFSARDINTNLGSKSYGAYIRLDHPRMEWDKHYNCMITVTDVVGECIVVNLGDLFFQKDCTYLYWDFFDLNWFFGILTNHYGQVEPGYYTWRLFCDGREVVDKEFIISE